MPARESPSEMCMRGGGSPGKPLMWRIPPIALEQQLLPPLPAKIERDALFVPGLHAPPEGTALVAGLPPLTQGVGLPRRLDLDHLGPHVAEKPAGEGPGKEHPQLDDPDAGEWPRPVRVGADTGVGMRRRDLRHATSSPRSSASWASRKSLASRTCSVMIISARFASPAPSARVSCL